MMVHSLSACVVEVADEAEAMRRSNATRFVVAMAFTMYFPVGIRKGL